MSVTFLGVYLTTMADLVKLSALTQGELLIGGRGAEYLFGGYSAMIMLDAFLARAEAILAWFCLCAVFPIQFAAYLAIEPQIYFTTDLYGPAKDGNAVNTGVFFQEAVLAIFITASLMGLTLFNRWALVSGSGKV